MPSQVPDVFCDGARVALVSMMAGVTLHVPSGTSWTTERLALPTDAVGGFALRGDRLFAGTGNVIRVLRHAKVLGEPCAGAESCVSGFCVDGVCCDTACGGADPNDCQACSPAAGGSQAGTCTPSLPAEVCRAAKGECDLPDRCDGTSRTCPADAVAQNGAACAGGACSAGSCVAGSTPSSSVAPEVGAPADAEPGGDSGCSFAGPNRRNLGELTVLALTLALAVLRRRRERSA